MSARFRARKTFRVGPFTHNLTRGTSSVNTPGPGSVHFGGRRRGGR